MIARTVILVLCLIIELNADQFQKCLNENNSTADIVKRGNQNYDDLNYQWNVRKLRTPKSYIVVKSSEDVSSSIKCLIKLGLNFTTKCGGHSYEKYSFGDSEFWVIELSKLDNVEVDPQTNIAIVGAGIRTQMLSERLWDLGKYGLPVGTCFSVGISGFTLGGGYGPMSRKYGMMVDRVIAMEVVTADAKVLHVNQHQYSDLFWGLRGGGGGNFAVVTKFYFKVFDASQSVVLVQIRYKRRRFPTAFRNWQNWLRSNPSNFVGSLVRFKGPEKYVDFEFLIDDDCESSRKHLKSIKRHMKFIKDEKHVKILSYVEAMKRISTPYFSKTNTTLFYYKSTSFYVSKCLTNKEILVFNKVLAANKDVMFMLNTYGGAINEKDETETAFCHRNSMYILQFAIIAITDMYPDLNTTIANGKQKESQLRNIRKNLSFMNNGESYINYIDEEIKDPFQAYYCNNNDLREVKKKYDPNNVFMFPLSIPLP